MTRAFAQNESPTYEAQSLKVSRFAALSYRIGLLRSYLRGDSVCPGVPPTAIIATTHRCNMTCRMCIRASRTFDESNLEPDLFRKVVDDGIPHLQYISLDGPGETTLNPDAFPMIGYAKSRGVRVLFSTNALLVDEAMTDRILDSGLDEIIFSVNGTTPEMYASVHGPDVYQRVVDNIHCFLIRKLERRAPVLVAVQMVRLRETLANMGAFYRQWNGVAGVDFVRVKKDVVAQSGVEEHPHSRRNPCPRLWYGPLFVETNGDVYASPGVMYKAPPVGNVSRKRLADIWNDEPMQALRRAHTSGAASVPGECAGCAYPRPRLPVIMAGFLLDPFTAGKLVPWAEKMAFWHHLPVYERLTMKSGT